MGPNDQIADDQDEPLSSCPPFLPAGTLLQMQQPQGFGRFGLGGALTGITPSLLGTGLAGALGAQNTPLPNGLADALMGQQAPKPQSYNPKLMDMTMDLSKPTYLTANGTQIQMNKPAPATTLPWGDGLDRLIKFADSTGVNTVKISGGTEAKGHRSNSAHPENLAIDVSADNDLDDDTVRKAALAAGYTHGMYEIRPGGVKHWHLQVGPENIRNASQYDLRKGPIRTVDYTKDTQSPASGGTGGN